MNRFDKSASGARKTYRILFIDADDTLFDYQACEDYSLDAALSHFGIVVTEELRSRYGSINKELWAAMERGEVTVNELRVRRFDTLLREYGLTVSASEVSKIYLDHLSRSSFLIEGAVELLSELRKRGIPVIVVTNGIHEVQLGRFAVSSLAGLTDAIVTSGEAGASKPDPAFFAFAARKSGLVQPGETLSQDIKKTILMVGDSLSSDIPGGKAFGLDTCWFNPQGLENDTDQVPYMEIRRLQELLQWFPATSSPPFSSAY